MPIRTVTSPNLTPRERAELDWEKESTHLQAALVEKQDQAKVELERIKANHDLVIRRLGIDNTKLKTELEQQLREAEMDIKRLEVKWLTILKIPLNIVLLPVKFIMALAIPIAAITGKELDKHFWEIMKW